MNTQYRIVNTDDYRSGPRLTVYRLEDWLKENFEDEYYYDLVIPVSNEFIVYHLILEESATLTLVARFPTLDQAEKFAKEQFDLYVNDPALRWVDADEMDTELDQPNPNMKLTRPENDELLTYLVISNGPYIWTHHLSEWWIW